jgi:DNA processing protein
MYSEDLLYGIALSTIFKYRVNLPKSIIENLGSAGALFGLCRDELEHIFGKQYGFIDDILDKSCLEKAQKEIDWCHEKGIKIHYYPTASFPSRLKDCSDSPVILYSYGDVDFNFDKTISIVGTRRSTAYGTKACRKIIEELSAGGFNPIIVSGLAFGIDICAHKAALESGLRTIAVLATALDTIYPSQHHSHAISISKQGALLTEFARGTESFKLNFVQRNRIIAGISAATIVIESGEKGGALITAELAHSYSRELFAVPGRISDSVSIGCNKLISRNLASIFTSAEDFLISMGWDDKSRPAFSKEKKLFYTGDPEKEKILVALRQNLELNIDELHRLTGQRIQDLSVKLLELEIEGLISSIPGNRYSLS